MSKSALKTNNKVRVPRASTTSTNILTTEMIRQRAEQIYLETGNEDAVSNWLLAEKDLKMQAKKKASKD
jgi:hypothetical protein